MARARSAAVLTLVGILLTGCASSDGVVTRNGDRELGEQNQPEVATDSVTLVPPKERKVAPVVSGPDLMGQGTVSTTDYAGRVIVLNVWGSWCGPCRKEAPDLVEANRQTAEIASFVGLDIRDNSADSARAFVRGFKINYPHIYDPDGQQLLKFAGTLPPNGIPSTVVIDKQGRMAARIVGIVTTRTLVTIVTDVAADR